jgi:hypothetical protein
MFKKITLSFLTLLLLCSCSYQEPRKVHTEQSEISKNFPIILLDAKDSIDQAHIICAIQSGQLQPTNKYQYNNQALSSFLFKPATEVHTNIIDTDKIITFIDPVGKHIESDVELIYCEGQAADETVRVRAEISHPDKLDSQWLLGTYKNVNIFPNDIDYGDDFISVDLDADGNRDVISWAFTPADNTIYGNDFFYFTIMLEQDGATLCIKEDRNLPIREDDLAVFVADLNLDGCFELIVCERGMSQFGIVNIYQFSDSGYTITLDYYLNGEP